jgi:hypothetical protein
MENQKKPSHLEQMLEAAQANIPVKVLSKDTRETLANFPAPGSMEATAIATGRKTCPQCHALIRLGVDFCQNCGAKVAAPSQAG